VETLVYTPAAAARLFDPPRRAYLLFGEDDRQKDEAIGLLQAVVIAPDFADFDLEVLDAESAGSERILSAAGLAPLGSPRRLVVVRGSEVLRRKDRQADADALAAGIARLGPQSCLVLRVAATEDEGPRGKTAISPRLDAAVREHGLLIRCRRLREEELADWAVAHARRAGKELAEEAAHLLVHAARGDRHVLAAELEKALCYAGERPVVTLRDVEAVRSYDPEDAMFKLVDAVCQRNPDRALLLLREALRWDTRPQSVSGRMLALLARQLRLLWQARGLMERGVDPAAVRSLPDEAAALLPQEGSIATVAFKAGELFRTARKWTWASLCAAFDAVLECDLACKGSGEGSEDAVANLELLIVRLCGCR